MGQQLISYKSVLFIGLLIALIISIHTSTIYSEKDTVVICNEKSGTTLVVMSHNRRPVVVGEGNSKDILSCIGKSLPFYSREIDSFVSSSKENHQILQERYKVFNGEVTDKIHTLGQYEDLYLINTNSVPIIVGVKQEVSPFVLEKYLSKGRGTIVYMPENSPKIDELLRNMIEDKAGEFHTLKIGEKTVLPLF